MVGFIILAILATLGAIGVVTFRQPVHAALSLVGTLLTLAVTYVTLEAHFLGAIQVIVYAGAIMVLFLFVIMLLNVGGGPKVDRFRALRPLAILVGGLGAAGIALVAFLDARPLPGRDVIDSALAGGGAGRVGDALFSDFLFAFHLVGVLLLTGIIGAVGLVQRRPQEAQQVVSEPTVEPHEELTHA